MLHLDCFSGIGGFALAASWVWGKEHHIHSFIEIDPFCQKVLNKHWPGVPIHSDIRSYTVDTHVNQWYNRLSDVGKQEIIDMANKSKQYDLAVDLYNSGLSIQDVANFYGITRQGMWGILKCRGCVFRDQLKFGKENHFYREGMSAPDRIHHIVELAIEKGLLIKPTHCEQCNSTNVKINSHHDDYNKPLKVRWVCSKCHFEWHKINKPIELSIEFPPMDKKEICSRGGSRKEVMPDELLQRIEDATNVTLLTGGFP